MRIKGIKPVVLSVQEVSLEKELLFEGFPVLSYSILLPKVEHLTPGAFRRVDRCYRKLQRVFAAWCEGDLLRGASNAWGEALEISAPFMPARAELACEVSRPEEDLLMMRCSCRLFQFRKAPVTLAFPAAWHLPDGWLFPHAFAREKAGRKKKKGAGGKAASKP